MKRTVLNCREQQNKLSDLHEAVLTGRLEDVNAALEVDKDTRALDKVMLHLCGLFSWEYCA